MFARSLKAVRSTLTKAHIVMAKKKVKPAERLSEIPLSVTNAAREPREASSIALEATEGMAAEAS